MVIVSAFIAASSEELDEEEGELAFFSCDGLMNAKGMVCSEADDEDVELALRSFSWTSVRPSTCDRMMSFTGTSLSDVKLEEELFLVSFCRGFFITGDTSIDALLVEDEEELDEEELSILAITGLACCTDSSSEDEDSTETVF